MAFATGDKIGSLDECDQVGTKAGSAIGSDTDYVDGWFHDPLS
jgi:hypothetical protein